MKVIERREVDDQRVGRFKCRNCKSVVETEPSDIPRMHYSGDADSADPREYGYWSVPCPVCHGPIPLTGRIIATEYAT